MSNPFLTKDGSDDGLLFTTDLKDPNHIHINKHAITLVALNIPSFMGGRAVPWPASADQVGLKNPYNKSAAKSSNS